MFLFETVDGRMEREGTAGKICLMCVFVFEMREGEWTREKERERQLFSGHAKEEGGALVTWHILMSVNRAGTPVPFLNVSNWLFPLENSTSRLLIPLENRFLQTIPIFEGERNAAQSLAFPFASNVVSFRNAAGLYWCQFW